MIKRAALHSFDIEYINICAGGNTEVSAEVVFHSSGLQTLQGINCKDSLLKRNYNFNDQCQIYVLTDNQMFTSITSN